MPAMTLRMDDKLAKQLDKVCVEKGYKKNGLVLSLINEFLKKNKYESKTKKEEILSKSAQDLLQGKSNIKQLKKLVGIVSLGGDAVEDAEYYFE